MSKIYARPTKASPAAPPPVAMSEADPDLLHRNLSTAVIAFHDAVARCSGLGISEHKCLGALALMGQVTAGQLAEATGFTTGAITGIVDRLEKAGLVKREPNPNDRRSVIIQAVRDEGRSKRAVALFRPLTNAMANLRQSYSEQELALIYGYLARTTAILKEEAQKLEG